MKWYSRLKVFKASNVVFNPETLESTSYEWWLMTRKVKGVVLFNDYRLSNTTARHQAKIRSLFRSLNIRYSEVSAPRGLQDLNGAINYHQMNVNELTAKILNPRTRKATNEWRKEQVIYHVEKIKLLKSLTTE